MKNLRVIVAVGTLFWGASLPAEAQDREDRSESVRLGDAALTFASGSIKKSAPRIGLVNTITGDNQASGAKMILGLGDTVYLKMDHPQDVHVGDLFTVYRRVRKVFHPVTKEYLGFVTIRLAVVRATQVDDLTTVEVVRSYGAFNPGDLIDRFDPPQSTQETRPVMERGDLSGMIVDIQADPAMTLVAQRNIVYLDRGQQDGLVAGDVLDIYRKGLGMPSRKIGQMRILSTEAATATAQVMKISTRVMTGDKFKLSGQTTPPAPLSDVLPAPTVVATKKPASPEPVSPVIPSDLVARTLAAQDAGGQSRLNIGNVSNLLRFESGDAAIKADSYKVLDQFIEYLQSSGDDRLIRVEGHTDNMEIGPALKSRYPNNWELSKARANGVVRYLVEKGGVDSSRISAMAYGDSHPAAANDTEQGRLSNRRVEIILSAPAPSEPKATQAEPPAEAPPSGTVSSTIQALNTEIPASSADVPVSDSQTILESPGPNTSSATDKVGADGLPDTGAQPNSPAL